MPASPQTSLFRSLRTNEQPLLLGLMCWTKMWDRKRFPCDIYIFRCQKWNGAVSMSITYCTARIGSSRNITPAHSLIRTFLPAMHRLHRLHQLLAPLTGLIVDLRIRTLGFLPRPRHLPGCTWRFYSVLRIPPRAGRQATTTERLNSMDTRRKGGELAETSGVARGYIHQILLRVVCQVSPSLGVL